MTQDATLLEEVADGVFAYLQPDGAWGLSNAGLVVGSEEKLLVDTLYDLPRTRELLERLRRVTAFEPVATMVLNTHANGDHCYGNALLPGRRFLASKTTQREMLEMPASKMHKLMRAASAVQGLGRGRRLLSSSMRALGLPFAADFLDAAPYVAQCFGQFDFASIPTVLPTETFSGSLDIALGDRKVELLELGPAHTEGDVVAFLPATKTLFAGDLLFMGCHPLIWAGTPTSCIASLERLLSLAPEVVVPGHGPLTNRTGIEDHIEYYRALRDETRPLFDAKVSTERAARRLIERGFGSRSSPERLFVNVEAAYREFSPAPKKLSPITAMGAMSRLAGMA